MKQAVPREEILVPSCLPESGRDAKWFERIARASVRGKGPVTVRREDLQKMLSTLVLSMARG